MSYLLFEMQEVKVVPAISPEGCRPAGVGKN
jgi:hypothetical protein